MLKTTLNECKKIDKQFNKYLKEQSLDDENIIDNDSELAELDDASNDAPDYYQMAIDDGYGTFDAIEIEEECEKGTPYDEACAIIDDELERRNQNYDAMMDF